MENIISGVDQGLDRDCITRLGVGEKREYKKGQ